jgi:sigma-E factor negative regulatory protein RseA
MEKISELMDGELASDECSMHIRRLSKDPQLARRWDHYHLIRDVLRAEAGTRVDLVTALSARLQAEPTILAPRRRLQTLIARVALPAAAAVAGIMVGGWLSAPSSQPGRADLAKLTPPAAITAAAPKVAAIVPVAAQANGQVTEYILAHQEFSPTSAMHGAASYVRTLSFKDADSTQ